MVPEYADYPPAVLRVEPRAIPNVREALDTTLDELIPLLETMKDEAYIQEPWLGDSESHRVWRIYNDQVMSASDGPFAAMIAYRDQLQAARDRLAEIESEYIRTEGDNAALWGRA